MEEKHPDTDGVMKPVEDKASERLGVPVGVTKCVVGAEEGLPVPEPQVVGVPEETVVGLSDSVTLVEALPLTVCVKGAEVAAGLELSVPDTHVLAD